MVDETPELTYAAPLGKGEVRHHHGEDGVRFELGFPPTEVFVTRVAAEALLTALLAGLTLLTTPREAGWRLAIVGLWGLAFTETIVRLARHRHTFRVIGATPERVFYSGPHTRGKHVTIPRSDVESIGVRRSLWRPWVFELVAVCRPPRFWSVSAKPRGPVVLLTDVDHSALTRMAAAVRDVPRPAVPTPCPP
jgi:hypothetical protein